MPSGREIYTIQPYQLPVLDRSLLESMRSPPDGEDHLGYEPSSDDEERDSGPVPIGAFPGAIAPDDGGTPRRGGSKTPYY